MKNFFLHNREAALAVIVVALALLIGLRAPVFLTPSNLLDELTDSSILAILVMGQMVVLLTKGIDLSVASNRTNDIMKRLTIMSAIFLPLSFVTGFFGQNFTHLPFESTGLMVVMLVLCVVIPGGMLFWFSRSRWL